jgi:HlyD family secretion protein
MRIEMILVNRKMDRELSKEFKQNRKRKIVYRISLSIIIILVGIRALAYFISSEIDISNISMSTADIGKIESSFATMGTVEPFYQELITANIAAEILKINYSTGDLVGPKDTIFLSNTIVLQNQLRNIEREILLKINEISRNKEELNSKQLEMQNQLIMDSIQLEHLKSILNKEEYLLGIGGGSNQKVEQAKINFRLAFIKSDNLKNDFNSFKKLQTLDLERMNLELQLKENERTEIENKINQSFIKPKINGILTSLMVEPGQYVNSGQALAHISDAEKFKIKGSISSRYANQIYVSQEARILINDSVLKGQLMSISPSVSNGSIDYTIMLYQADHELLKAKQQVEVRLIVSKMDNAVRIANGDFYYGPGIVDLFVMNGENLEKRKVKLGGANFDFIRVISGVVEGEKVVISKTFNEKYQKHNTLKWKE